MVDAETAMQEPRHKGALDSNLRFPERDSSWQAFSAREACDIASTSDLDALTAQLYDHELDFCYLPAANFYFLRSDPAYAGVASARSVRTGKPEQASVLIVAKSNPAADWHALSGARLGYINTYCTTSYFAPSILLAREGLSLQSFFNAHPVAPWQGQIDAVIDGAIDATMVSEDVWLARAGNAAQTRILARMDGLPTPPFIARERDGDGFAERLRHELLAMTGAVAPNALYCGFGDYEAARMAHFFAEIARIPGMAKRGPRI